MAGEVGCGELVFNGYGAAEWDNEKALEVDDGAVCRI